MAAKVEKTTEGTAATIVAAVFLANWVCAQYLGFPFAWCWGKQVLQPVLEPFIFLIHFMALAYFLVCALSLSAINIAKGFIVVIVAFGFPTFMEILFRLGKSCT